MKSRERGFSAVEGLIVLVVVALIGAIGYFALHRSNSNSSYNSSTGTQKNVSAGTTESVNNLTTQDMSDESAVDSKYSNSYQSTAQSTDSAASNVGGAYNESSL